MGTAKQELCAVYRKCSIMHGFFGSYKQPCVWDLSAYKGKSFICRSHRDVDFSLTHITLPQFLKDKYFAETRGCFLATEGVLFESDQPEDAIQKYKKGDTAFWDSWRGSFAGILYDKKNDSLFLFNDHIGSKMLFYAKTNSGFVFASDLRILARTINATEYDEQFVISILNKGCTSDNRTFVHGIKRLTAGQYLKVCGETVEVVDYHRFDNTPWPYNEKMMVSKTNRLFRQAVERVIKKNEEEGLKHFYPLSGGLDSRMCQWIARQLTKKPITNFTFSQTGHYDHVLPKEISRTLGNEWLFMPLDGGEYIIKNIDSVCERTEWLVNYMLPIEIDYFAQQQTWTEVGVVLTGINGDNIFATETDNAHEIARIYTQGFNGNSLGSPLVMQHYTETYSPFCDVDVLDFVLHVPTNKRRNYYFYDKFVLACYPEAAQWHHKHMQIGNRPPMITILGRNIPLRDVVKRCCMMLLKRLHIYDGYRIDEDSMNPYDHWVKENPALTNQMQLFHDKYRQLISPYKWYKVCEEKMRWGSIMEKGKVLTIESAIVNLRIS